MPAGVAVNALGGVVGVEGENAVETGAGELAFHGAHLGLGGAAPELAVQVEAGAVGAGVARVADGIEQRVNREFVAGGPGGLRGETFEKSDGREHAGGLVTVETAEDRETNRVVGRGRAGEDDARDGVGVVLEIEGPGERRVHRRARLAERDERLQQRTKIAHGPGPGRRIRELGHGRKWRQKAGTGRRAVRRMHRRARRSRPALPCYFFR